MHQKIHLISKKKLYKGHHELYEYQLQLPSFRNKTGFKKISCEILHAPDSVMALIYVPKVDSFLLLREYRLGVFCNTEQENPFIYECVAGEIEAGDDPQETLCREIQEETGITSHHFQPIATVYPSPGISTEKTYLYYVEVEGVPETGIFGCEEEQEEILTRLISKTEVYQMMEEMRIIDALTLLALNWFKVEKGGGYLREGE